MPPPPTPPGPEALKALRERLEATHRAAQQLADDAARERRPPPAGWDVPRRAEEAGEELEALVRVIAGLREVLPPELRAQLAELTRQALLFVRAALDWWIERTEQEAARAAAGEAAAEHDGGEDIPIS